MKDNVKSAGYPKHQASRMGFGCFCVIIFLLSCVAGVFSEEAEQVLRSRVFRLKHIPNQKARDILGQLKTGGEVSLLGQDALIVTSSNSQDLVAASSIIELIDSKLSYAAEAAGAVPGGQAAPTPEQMAELVGDVEFGTFSETPAASSDRPAVIVDVCNSQIVVIAPQELLGSIAAAVKGNITQEQAKKSGSASAKTTSAKSEDKKKASTKTTETAAVQSTPPPPQPISQKPDASGEKPAAIQAVLPSRAQEPNVPGVPAAPVMPDIPIVPSGEPKAETGETVKSAVGQAGEGQAGEGLSEEQNIQGMISEMEKRSALEPDDKALIDILKALVDKEKGSEGAVEETKTEVSKTAPSAGEKPQPKSEQATAAKQAEKPMPARSGPPRPGQEGQKIAAAVGKAAGSEPSATGTDESFELASGVMELPETIEIKTLINMVGKMLGLNYIYEEKDVTGSVKLKLHNGKIKVSEAYELLEWALKIKKLVMIRRRGNLVTIVPEILAMDYDPTIQSPDTQARKGDIIVTGVFPLKHISTQTAENMLKNMKLGLGGNPFNSVPETGTLVVTDYAYRMSRIEEVLKLVDVLGEPRIFKSRQLQYTLATELVPKIQKMSEQLQSITISIGEVSRATAAAQAVRIDPTTGRPIPMPPQPSGPTPSAGRKTEPQKGNVYIEADDRTNRIIMIGAADDIEVVAGIIDNLDVREQSLKFVEEYKLQYVDAGEVVDVLNELGVIKTGRSTPSRYSPYSTPVTSRTRVPQPGAPGQPPVSVLPPQTTSGYTQVSENEPSISIRTTSNSLLINASAEQHEKIKMVISYIDVEQKDSRMIREYEIQRVDASGIVDTLEELGIITQRKRLSERNRSGYGTDRYGAPRTMTTAGGQERTEAPAPTLPSTEGTFTEIGAEEPQISILESTNSLLVNATPRQHAAIALIISHVDRDPEITTTPYVVYPLTNQKPTDLAKILEDLIAKTTQTSSTTETSKDGKIEAKPKSTVIREENEIKIIPDDNSYSLIVYANKKHQQWLGKLIETLDQYRPQVLLDVTLVEITKDNVFNMDLDIVHKYNLFLPKDTASGITGEMQSGGKVNALLSPFPSERIIESSSGAAGGIAFYADKDIQALLQLMDKKNYGRVLARPSLLVWDNQQGIIKTEKIIYIAQRQSQITPQQGGQAVQTENITFKDYPSGITLKIKPHIASERIMQLEIMLERKDFISGETTVEVAGSKYPKPLDTVSSNVETWAVLPDGATIILGGIETIAQSKTVTKVPFLGDIPIVGVLFRGLDETDKQSKLYVFVKAYIVRPSDELTGKSDIERISQQKREKFEDDEAIYQGLESLPGVKPIPMEPTEVLGDDEPVRKDVKKQKKITPPVKVKVN